MCVSEKGHGCIRSVSEKQHSGEKLMKVRILKGRPGVYPKRPCVYPKRASLDQKKPTLATTMATTRGHPNGHEYGHWKWEMKNPLKENSLKIIGKQSPRQAGTSNGHNSKISCAARNCGDVTGSASNHCVNLQNWHMHASCRGRKTEQEIPCQSSIAQNKSISEPTLLLTSVISQRHRTNWQHRSVSRANQQTGRRGTQTCLSHTRQSLSPNTYKWK